MTQASTNPQAGQTARLYGSVPAVVCTYGPRGYGKTTDLLYSFPRALFIARKGALKPAVNVVGYVPLEVDEADDVDALIVTMKKHLSNGKGGKYDAVVVDEWDMVVKAQERKLKSRFSDGRQLYGHLGGQAIQVADLARDFKCHTVFNCGFKEPGKSDAGYDYFGGPKLPGQMLEQFTGRCDVVLRADTDAMRKPWPVCYRVGPRPPNTGWIAKDRHGVTPDCSPMNTGELLRAAGYTVGRPPGLDWMEGIVAEYAAYILAGNPGVMVLTDLAKKAMSNNCPDWQVAWLLRDAKDRAEIAKWSSNRIGREFGIML